MIKLSKKIFGIVAAAAFIFTSCELTPVTPNKPGNSGNPTDVSEEETQDAVVISTPESPWAFITYSLSEFADQDVIIELSADMKVTNNGTKAKKLMWQVNTSTYPVIAEHSFEPGVTDFITVTGSNADPISLGADNKLYISTENEDVSHIKIELKNVKYKVSYKVSADSPDKWTDESVPSLYETYKDKFDYFGLACEYNSWAGVKELIDDKVCTGIKKHANSITMGNEFKPDGFFGWGWSGSGKTLVDFTAANGKTIKVPKTLNFDTVDKCLAQCKKHGLQMRGHVLVWHSQTPDNFFAEDYIASTKGELISNLVDKETMTARQEWYIKTVLEHVAEWEAENNDGNHIIWAWDVVNEAMADDAGQTYTGDKQNWLRGSTKGTMDKSPSNGGSRWYQIYGSDEFIVNAFRFANAYAPSDVKLCYNDYNEYMNYSAGWKTDAICHIVDEIKNGAAQTINGNSVKPRIDAVGMQSHVGISWPGVNGYESAIKAFLAKDVNIHVTELDFSAESKADAANAYKDYFTLFQKYGNNSSKTNKIECVTLWGINNKSSWIYKDNVKYPLLFDNFNVTDSYWAVIKAHQ